MLWLGWWTGRLVGPWGLAVAFPPVLCDRCVTGLCMPVASQSVLHFKTGTGHCLSKDIPWTFRASLLEDSQPAKMTPY